MRLGVMLARLSRVRARPRRSLVLGIAALVALIAGAILWFSFLTPRGVPMILWRDTSGAVYIWLMDGTKISGVGSPGTAATNWTIQ